MKNINLAALVALALFATRAQLAGSPAVADFAWMSGHWCGGTAPEHIEEYWLAPRGGTLIGMSRTTRAERTLSFEFLRIAAVDSEPTFIAQPNGGTAVSFRWTRGGNNWARFENPAHDFPKRIEYRREGERLHAEIAGPGDGGKEQIIPFDYERCATD